MRAGPTQEATLSVVPGQSYWPVCVPLMKPHCDLPRLLDDAFINPHLAKIFERVRQSADFMPLKQMTVRFAGGVWGGEVELDPGESKDQAGYISGHPR